MRRLKLECQLDAPAEAVWTQLLHFELHARRQPAVQVARVLSGSDRERVTEWSVLLRGSPLRWSQVERIDPELRSVQFRLHEGEPKSVDGSWSVSSAGPAAKVEIDIEVNFGLPRIASVFDAMVVETLTGVLRGIAQSAASAARPGEGSLNDVAGRLAAQSSGCEAG